MKPSTATKLLIVISLPLLLLLTNPGEHSFLKKVSKDYGSIHHGFEMNENKLLEIGESHYESYYLFSNYTYNFGSISVSYFGIANSIFFVKSGITRPEMRNANTKSI